MRRRLTPGTAIALIALFTALAGTATAGTVALITGAQIKNGSVGLVDLSASAKRALKGKRGPAGEPGIDGAPGAPGTAGIASLTAAIGPAAFQCAGGGGACQVATSKAFCPTGSYAVGGGFSASTPDNIVGYAAKTGPSEYTVIATNYFPSSATIQAQVICASGPGLTSTATGVSSAEISERLQALRAAVR